MANNTEKAGKKDGMKHFLLIDGSSLIFRAFYAIRNLTTKDGIHTNGVYGFLTMYAKALDMIDPDYVLVAFDRSGPTFRTKDYEDYKANRQKAPEELSAQFGVLKDVLNALNVVHIDMDGFEADDIIGTIAKKNDDEKIQNFLLTGDRDYYQLVDANTKVLYTKKGISVLEIVDEDYIQEEYGIEPEQLIDVKGLQGDTSDNIPGVPGIGEKTALKLIRQYGDIESVYDHIDEISGKKMKENLEENKAQAFMSKRLGTIFTEVPIDQELADFAVQKPDQDLLKDRFQRLEFNSLAERFGVEKTEEEVEDFSGEFLAKADWANFLEEFKDKESFSFILLGDGENYIHSNPIFLGIKAEKEKTYLIDIREDQAEFVDCFKELFESESHRKLAYDVKESMVLLRKLGIRLDDKYQDVMLMEYLIDPSRTSYDVANLGSSKLGITVDSKEDVQGKGAKRKEFDELDPDLTLNFVAGVLNVIEKARPILVEELEELEMLDLYISIENPLAKVLANMEEVGIEVDESILDELGQDFSVRLEEIEGQIYDYAGEEFNVNSPKQLGDILFEKMGLPHGKKTKTGYSTAASVLEPLRNEHPIIDRVLEYRQLSKLISTYVDGLKPYIDEDNRIRSTFRQNVAATGRLSSTEPNLQNIPIRTEEGRKLRAVFIAKEGHKLIDVDYSQIELRVLASLSGDDTMIQAFKDGQDIHAKTASEVEDKAIEDVTPLERSHAKAVNFGIIYGISDYGLSQDLGISRQRAKEYIENYKDTYPEIKQYMEDIVDQAKEDGYVDTYYGRRRNIPELKSKNFNVRNFGERIALNTPIQGTAADIIKIAMIQVDKALEEGGYKARLLLQVHDELILEVTDDEVEEVGDLVVKIMEGVTDFEVDMVADKVVAKSWYEATE